MKIKRVNVEFLRPGPPQNQLLSPLTPYLVTCGDSGAGVVHVPFEQAEFERRLKELHYETGDPEDRLAMLNMMGEAMGRMLGAVPGLAGSLAFDSNQRDTLTHLRLTVSASELALLPLELARNPVSATTTGEGWLSVGARPPVCVTRNVRGVSSDGVVWPDKPRILFIAGDRENLPYAEHERLLLEAIEPFLYPKRDRRRETRAGRVQYGELLTMLENPTLGEIQDECRQYKYTHVHVLAHGDLADTCRDAFGLVLRDEKNAQDVVIGERFACALCPMTESGVHWPTIVTIASCNLAHVGSVLVPGASFAHALHHAGIPLVVASQFPLSVEGSVSLTRALYEDLLWGRHPLGVLQRVRCELHARHSSVWHDWASLVVYEALPRDIDRDIEALQYRQARMAMDAALEHIDRAVSPKNAPRVTKDRLVTLESRVNTALSHLPISGEYGVECLGLRASARKRLAQAVFALSRNAADLQRVWNRNQVDLLDTALQDYEQAVGWLMTPGREREQRIAALHWVMVQVASIRAILGREWQEDEWRWAELSAKFHLDAVDAESLAWAHGSLAELYLLQLTRPETTVGVDSPFDKVRTSAEAIAKLYPSRTEFPVTSTRRQFRRYVEWWGSREFEQMLEARGGRRQGDWHRPRGLIEAAKLVIDILRGPEEGPDDEEPPAAGGDGSDGGASHDGQGTPDDGQPGSGAAPASRSKGASAGAALGTPSAARRRAGGGRSGAFFDVEMLPAGHGDCLWIEYGRGGETHRILVDCGTDKAGKLLADRVEALPADERRFELFVMSHVDADHIGGALPYLRVLADMTNNIGDVWFNGWRHVSASLGARQGEMFSTALRDFGLPWNDAFDEKAVVLDGGELPVRTLPGGMKLTLLSPTHDALRKLAPAWTRELKKAGLVPGGRVDYKRFLKGKPSTSTDVDALAATPFTSDAAPANGSSIALLAEFEGASILLGADAHAPALEASIDKLLEQQGRDRLALSAFKLPHHGSQFNVSPALLARIDCKRYLVSTNGDYFYHPDREAVARVIKHGGARPEFFFNYRSQFNSVWDDAGRQATHQYTANFGDGAMLVRLLPERGR